MKLLLAVAALLIAAPSASAFELRPGERLDAPAYLAQQRPVGYQWLRCDTHGYRCQNIPAHGRIYTMRPGDVGHRVRVRMFYARRLPVVSGASAVVFPVLVRSDAASWS